MGDNRDGNDDEDILIDWVGIDGPDDDDDHEGYATSDSGYDTDSDYDDSMSEFSESDDDGEIVASSVWSSQKSAYKVLGRVEELPELQAGYALVPISWDEYKQEITKRIYDRQNDRDENLEVKILSSLLLLPENYDLWIQNLKKFEKYLRELIYPVSVVSNDYSPIFKSWTNAYVNLHSSEIVEGFQRIIIDVRHLTLKMQYL